MTISPIDGEALSVVLQGIKDTGIDVHSFSLVQDVATVQLLVKQREYTASITSLLECTKDYKVDIS